jgi:tetratricopeptide (TPR) repeat protein
MAEVHRFLWLLPAILVAVGLAAYANSFHAAFVYDDKNEILLNPAIQQISWKELLGRTRPLTYLSLAINYRLGGLDVRGYHIFNLVIHLLAGLTLYGLVRRSLLQLPSFNGLSSTAAWLALGTALLWLVHPLQTESVTYVIQRLQSIMGLFYLLTLYCLAVGATSDRPGKWYAAAIGCCALGMASKEDMITAPVAALLYDRIFLSRSWPELWCKRWQVYLGLAATWCLLASSFIELFRAQDASQVIAPSAGFRVEGKTPLRYAASQSGVILYYLRLTLWPHPLCLDYAWPSASSAGEIVPCALGLLVFLLTTAWALWRQPALGFLGAWFFLTLAPTSSFLPINDLLVEHRMYLPLAAPATLTVLAIYAGLCHLENKRLIGLKSAQKLGFGLVAIVITIFCFITWKRNQDYASELGMWQDVVARRPDNRRARYCLAALLTANGRAAEAVEHFKAFAQARPDYEALANVANALAESGNKEEAIGYFRDAIRIADGLPDSRLTSLPDCHFVLAQLLNEQGQLDDAMIHYREVVRLRPGHLLANNILGRLLANRGQLDEAIICYERALSYRPNWPVAHNNLGLALARQGRFTEAIDHYREALRGDPDYANALSNWGTALLKQGNLEGAVAQYRKATQMAPDKARALFNLAHGLYLEGHAPEAAALYTQALRLDPDWPRIAAATSWHLATQSDVRLRDGPEAIRLAQQASQATGERNARFVDVLAAACAAGGRFAEATVLAHKAEALARADAKEDLAKAIAARASLYEKRHPYVEERSDPDN